MGLLNPQPMTRGATLQLLNLWRVPVELKGKRVIALGERDGVQGAAIANCARSSGAEVVLEMTHCFV